VPRDAYLLLLLEIEGSGDPIELSFISDPMSFNFTYQNWTAPPVEQLNFATNCTLVGKWSNAWYAGQDKDSGIDNIVISSYFRAALPSEIQSIPTPGQLIDWYHAARSYGYSLQIQNKTNAFIEATIFKPFNACPKEFCAGVPFDGTADVTGVGVSILCGQTL
jgi:hypothetical protein